MIPKASENKKKKKVSKFTVNVIAATAALSIRYDISVGGY